MLIPTTNVHLNTIFDWGFNVLCITNRIEWTTTWKHLSLIKDVIKCSVENVQVNEVYDIAYFSRNIEYFRILMKLSKVIGELVHKSTSYLSKQSTALTWFVVKRTQKPFSHYAGGGVDLARSAKIHSSPLNYIGGLTRHI